MQLTNWLQKVISRTTMAVHGGSVGRPIQACGSFGRLATTGRRPATARWGVATAADVEILESRELLTINVVIDYSLDTNNFFNTQEKKDLLQTAADAIGSRLTDTLSAITPSGSNTWTAIFEHPATGTEATVNNRSIAANTVVVYAGGRDLPANQAGVGGFGGYDASGSNSFFDILDGRGQAGVLLGTPTDFGPWGGAITFDTVGTTWHFGTTTSGLDNSKVDFLTVAQHELAHLFGFGTAPSWQNQISGSNFTGPVSKAANGNVNVPLGDSGHWALSVTSGGELATMRPTLTQGERHLMTAIDFAGLDDLGWTVTTPVLLDFGDAPDTTSGTGAENYQTLSSNNGPRHTIASGLFLGDRVDADNGLQANAAANADDQFTSPGADDEDGVLSPVDLLGTVGAAPTISLLATNTTGSAATLFGWIDYNQNGLFDNATERAQVTVPTGTTDGRFTLTFPTIPVGSAGATYARFRLSTDVAAANSTGAASNGEVEDYRFTITKPSTGSVSSSVKLSSGQNGTPSLTDEDSFGSSVTSIGDLDGDGVTDLVVGAERDGAIYVLRMNANGTVKSSTKIASGTNGITSGAFFGSSVASIGDVDGDGVTDLAVGASNDATGQLGAGAVYVLRLNADGTVKSSTKIASGLNGGPALANNDQFGTSVASLGDLDGDGVTDLAVGAINDSSAGTQRGVVYVLRLNADGTVKVSTKIASGTNGGPTLANFDLFGSSVASLGDLDGDGVTDLAVGARGDSAAGADRGAVYVLRMNANGTVKSSTKIASGTNGGPALANNDRFGSSVASLGDLDGDGVTDLAVGANGDDTNGNSRGAIYVLRLNADGTANSSTKIASGTNGGPALTDLDLFGSSVTAVGDLNGDGVTDLAVGAKAQGDGINPAPPGSVHVLFLERVNQPPTVANPIPDQTAIVGVPFSFTIPANTFTDPDGDPLTILADEISPWLSFDSATRTYSGTPGPDDLGSVELFVVAIDPQGLNTDDVFIITVSNQNVAPSFTKGANVVRPGDGAVQTISGWATNINDGSSGSQALDFQVTIPSANAGLFNVAPAISSDGTLTFTPKPGATGTVTVTVRLHDNGGTANGGADLSPAQTFTIQLTGLNKTPSFTKGTNPAINEDVSLQTIVTWAKSISAGTAESGQTVAFTVTNNNNALFSQQPAIAPNGTLTFSPTANANGTATVTVQLQDNGGTTGGGVDTFTTTFTITVNAINDAPVLATGSLPTINVAEDSATTTAVPLGLNGVTYSPGPTNEASQTLTYKITAIPTFLKLFKANGTTAVAVGGTVTAAELQGLTYKTVANLFGSGQIKFTVTDSGSATAPNVNLLTQTINITVTPVNDGGPTISTIANVTTNEDTPTAAIKFTVTDIDDALVNLNAIIVTATSSNSDLVPNSPSNIVLGGSLGARTIQLKPALDKFGSTTITVTATDSSNVSTTTTFVLTVNPVNDVPRVTAATLSVSEITTNDFQVGTVTAVDPEGAAITAYSILAGNTNNAFKIDNSGVIRVNDASKIDFETLAKYTLTIKATDAGGGFSSTAAQTGPITINVINEFVNRTVDAVNSDNTVTVLRVGNNLVARRGAVDLFSTAVEEVGTLTINGGTAKDTVILDASLNSAGTPATKKFTGQIVVNGSEGDDRLDASKITVTTISITFNGGTGNDTAIGGSGHDRLNGDDGDDSLTGNAGNDSITGGAGNDRQLGGLGNDVYFFADTSITETDTLTELAGTGTGSDTLDFNSVTNNLNVDLLNEVNLATHTNRTVNTSATGTTKLSGNFENVIGGSGNDEILGNAAANNLRGGIGNDSLDGDSGNDILFGDDGDDAIRGNLGNDQINGGTGTDTLLGEAGNDTIHGNAGDDTLIGGLGADQLFGDDGTDTGLGGRGGAARGGTGVKDAGDVLATVETINEAFSTVFDFE